MTIVYKCQSRRGIYVNHLFESVMFEALHGVDSRK